MKWKVFFCITLFSAGCVYGQTSEPAGAGEAAIQVFNGPRMKKLRSSLNPPSIVKEGVEGWAYLNMMVDPEGKPYEIAVIDSNGHEQLNKFIVKSFSTTRFEPASENGNPIHSSFSIRFTMRNKGSSGARKEFISLHQKLIAEINANDRENAVATLASMKTTRLYEDAYLNFAKYIYSAKWGTESEQIESLRHAVAYEVRDRLIPDDMYKTALTKLLLLQAKTNDLSGAMDSWQKLRTLGLTDNENQKMNGIVEQIEALRGSDQLIQVAGEIGSLSSWHITLFKRKFQIEVSTGRIDEIKLRCEKKYVFFPFNPDLSYEVSPTAGQCHLELVGSQGTKFHLFQS